MNTDMKIINQIACLKVDTLGTLFLFGGIDENNS